jgi:hypothetical protein
LKGRQRQHVIGCISLTVGAKKPEVRKSNQVDKRKKKTTLYGLSLPKKSARPRDQNHVENNDSTSPKGQGLRGDKLMSKNLDIGVFLIYTSKIIH